MSSWYGGSSGVLLAEVDVGSLESVVPGVVVVVVVAGLLVRLGWLVVVAAEDVSLVVSAAELGADVSVLSGAAEVVVVTSGVVLSSASAAGATVRVISAPLTTAAARRPKGLRKVTPLGVSRRAVTPTAPGARVITLLAEAHA
ncbi:hypothetical protein GCM10017786_55280 [Amycolatopsis deserti]|uniref:Uncharacterized protein n=1 Tax=Amycolatopsis deserti TaxID=185696 RepID=A0ABQ3JBI4_9PSEU|nr:hypothetical protein GCM10017786_55280 [Amycolatopsis deserti]